MNIKKYSKKKKYYKINNHKTKNIKNEIVKSIYTKLIGEERISLSLSGGIDSTIIASVLSKKKISKILFQLILEKNILMKKNFKLVLLIIIS